jgi:hypothetical protein
LFLIFSLCPYNLIRAILVILRFLFSPFLNLRFWWLILIPAEENTMPFLNQYPTKQSFKMTYNNQCFSNHIVVQG